MYRCELVGSDLSLMKLMYNAWNIDYKKDDCVNSKQIADTILSLPIHAYLTLDEKEQIIEKIKSSI